MNPNLSLETLAQYRAPHAPPPPADATILGFWSPYDDIHGLLIDVVNAVTNRLELNVYTFTDPELAKAVLAKAADATVFVDMTLDASETRLAGEEALLAQFQINPAVRLVIGSSSRGAIDHSKIIIADSRLTLIGSTNFTLMGEEAEDDLVAVVDSPAFASDCSAYLAKIRNDMLSQQAAGRQPQAPASATSTAQPVRPPTVIPPRGTPTGC